MTARARCVVRLDALRAARHLGRPLQRLLHRQHDRRQPHASIVEGLRGSRSAARPAATTSMWFDHRDYDWHSLRPAYRQDRAQPDRRDLGVAFDRDAGRSPRAAPRSQRRGRLDQERRRGARSTTSSTSGRSHPKNGAFRCVTDGLGRDERTFDVPHRERPDLRPDSERDDNETSPLGAQGDLRAEREQPTRTPTPTGYYDRFASTRRWSAAQARSMKDCATGQPDAPEVTADRLFFTMSRFDQYPRRLDDGPRVPRTRSKLTERAARSWPTCAGARPSSCTGSSDDGVDLKGYLDQARRLRPGEEVPDDGLLLREELVAHPQLRDAELRHVAERGLLRLQRLPLVRAGHRLPRWLPR